MARRAARGALVGVFCLFGDRLPVTPEVLAEAASSGAWEFFEGLMAAHPDVVLLPRTLEAAAAAVSDPFGSCRVATNSLSSRCRVAVCQNLSSSPLALSQGHQHVLCRLESLREHRWLAWKAEEASPLPFADETSPLADPPGGHRSAPRAPECHAASSTPAAQRRTSPDAILSDHVDAGWLSASHAAQLRAMLRSQHPAVLRKAACRKQWLQVSLLALDSGVAAAAAEAGCLDIVYWVARKLKHRFDPFPALCAAIAGRHPRLAMFVARKWRTRLTQQQLSRCWTMARRAGQGQVSDAMLCLLLSCLDRPATPPSPTAGPGSPSSPDGGAPLAWPRAPPPSPARPF